jgi:sugar phosphate isomerase/epimerase
MVTRRDWIRAAGQAAIAAAFATRGLEGRSGAPRRSSLTTAREQRRAAFARSRDVDAGAPATMSTQQSVFCLFSKPLPELGWSDLGRAVKEAGFDGVDLTVRAKGHVLPERAADDLPRAIASITAHGVSVPMITTELTSAGDPLAKPLLETAARKGVRYFKTGYWRYTSADVRAHVAAAGSALAGLAALARECGIQMGFHNHAAYVGAALWDIAPAIDRLDPQWAGYYFDPRHAVADGGEGAWKAATHLVSPRLKMLAVKDCAWEKTPKGWRVENCPLGEGMVDWVWVGSALRDASFGGPISIHLEYDIPAGTAQERTARTLEAASRDLAFARRFLGGGRSESRGR